MILGVLQRSGTNFVTNLINLHPDCGRPELLYEDHFLAHAHHAERFFASVAGSWNPKWAAGRDLTGELLARLGVVILDEIRGQVPGSPRAFTTTTPAVTNLHLFPALFSGARLVLLVRNGPAVVESGVRSFGWSYEDGMDRWVQGARAIVNFRQSEVAGTVPHLLVRYEDVVAETETEIGRIVEFVGLDPARYPFEQARTLPVVGSSETATGDGPSFEKIEKPPGFDPLARAKHWPVGRRARFAWKAGGLPAALGYDGAVGPVPMGWRLYNRVADLMAWGRR
jgi:hypothetical protein